jgi:electron transfer flavoprotein alpha subunit
LRNKEDKIDMAFNFVICMLGNAIATVKSNDKIKVVTVRGTAFEAAAASGDAASEEAAPSADKPALTQWISEEIQKSDRPDLGTAKRVISGGRGMKNGENFSLLYDLADKIGAAGTHIYHHVFVRILT